MKRITIVLALPLLLLTFISQLRAQTLLEPEWQLLTHSLTAMSQRVHVGDVVTTTWAVPVENMVDDDTFYLTFITRSGDILMDAKEPFLFPSPDVDYHFRCGPHYPPHQLSCTGADNNAASVIVGVKFETVVTACLEGQVVSEGYAVYWREGQYISEHISSLKLPCRNGGE